jgi:hypothetical protein
MTHIELELSMSPTHSRVAAGVAAFLFAMAVADITMAMAQTAPSSGSTSSSPKQIISTTCGAGTLTQCSTAPVETCDFAFGFSIDKDKGLTFNFGWTNCKVTGSVPIYKDNERDSYTLSEACNLINVFLGMPAGSGCSD